MRLVPSFGVATLASALLLAGCGGGGGGNNAPVTVATSDATVAINPTSGPAIVSQVLNKPVAFSAGVPEFATTASTTVTLSGTPTAPTVRAVSTRGEVREGVLEYGSCWFRVTTADPPAPPNWVVGNRFLVEPCSFTVDSAGVVTGTQTSGAVSLTFGTTSSTPVPVTYTITQTGGLIIGDEAVGTVNVTPHHVTALRGIDHRHDHQSASRHGTGQFERAGMHLGTECPCAGARVFVDVAHRHRPPQVTHTPDHGEAHIANADKRNR